MKVAGPRSRPRNEIGLLVAAGLLLPIASPLADTSVLVSVANIDILPNQVAAARRLLNGFMDKASDDPTMVNCTLLRQAGSENHFILLETFRGKAEYDAHAQAGYVRTLRSALFTYLGSPYDERYGTEVVR